MNNAIFYVHFLYQFSCFVVILSILMPILTSKYFNNCFLDHLFSIFGLSILMYRFFFWQIPMKSIYHLVPHHEPAITAPPSTRRATRPPRPSVPRPLATSCSEIRIYSIWVWLSVRRELRTALKAVGRARTRPSRNPSRTKSQYQTEGDLLWRND